MIRSHQQSQVHLADLIESRKLTIGIVGMGYVGLPLALTALRAGFRVIGFDIDQERIACLSRGESGIRHISSGQLTDALERKLFRATANVEDLGEPDVILIAVPTPLSKHREPNLEFVERSARSISRVLRPGQLIVLESTTWPGTTKEVVQPILEETGLRSGIDFYLAYSPEREDPGNPKYGTSSIPKVVGADHPDAQMLACALYNSLVEKVVAVSSASVAEATKLTENIFRAVNIALVNELKVVFTEMGIDIWEVLDAASTKPFGYMPFYPGPGLGGHCIPIDPFYLTWKAREYDVTTRFIELAGEVNTAMPEYVVKQLAEALDQRHRIGLKGASILLIGLAYKKNIDDTRESPSLKLIDILERRGSLVEYHDPLVSEIPVTREHSSLRGRRSVELNAMRIASYDAVLVATDHDVIDWAMLAEAGKLVIDTRNVFRRLGLSGENIVKA